jgi:hypothetical protein
LEEIRENCVAVSAECPADVNGDGMVAVQDILLVLSSYGSSCLDE